MKEIKIIPENINLFYIKVNESNINDSDKIQSLNFNVNVAHNIQNNLTDERIKVELILDIKSTDLKNQFSANFNIEFHYKIIDLKDFYSLSTEDKGPVFSGVFMSTLIGISFSTARGMIYERLSKTNMRNVILPVIAPSKILFKK
tara:strand:+ start:413 stop:847 length:435 start_codon:yes stop_codon:yes gene_type:complete